MKKLINIFLSFALLALCANSYGINIREAIKRKLIKVEVRWKAMENAESISRQHGTNLRLTVKNITNGNIAIEVPAGFLFTPVDSTKQNMIIAEDLVFNTKPGQGSTKYAHGYCCEAHDGPPAENELYAIKKPAGDKLVKLAEFIHKDSLEGYAAQRAIWCITNNYDLWDINTSDSVSTKTLIKHTGELKGYSDREIQAAIKRSLKKCDKVFEKIIDLELAFENDTHVWIMIQGINNNTVRYVAQNEKVSKGTFKKEIGVSSLDFGAGTFYIRVYTKNGFMAEKKFVLDV
jgi:hypothetical protein